ncbi:MAG: ATP-binding protein [Chloroflexi bacterium]|nr:ATP-binding protein [Chloroflexota bacterium]
MTAPKQGFPSGLLRRSKRARLDYFAAYTIGHAIIVEALDAVLHAITQPIDTWTPVILVIGPAGVGKTTLIRAVERELARRLRQEIAANPGRLPFVSIVSDVPESGSFNWKDFCLLGLEAMNEPLIVQKVYLPPPKADLPSVLNPRTPANALRRALVSALIHRTPAAFLIDEAQQLAMIAGSRKLQHQMDYLKRLADATRVPPVLVGNYGLCLLRNQSAQLGRRTREIHVRRYDANRPQDAIDFQDIVLSFQYHLPLAERPDLIADWEYLYLRSVGCIGLLKQWLLDALDRAVEAGAPTITRADLERTAPPPSKSKKVLEEALDGEAKLAELDPETDPRTAEAELRSLLGLAPLPPPPSVAPRSHANAQGRRPGERKPVRDPVGPEGVEVAG